MASVWVFVGKARPFSTSRGAEIHDVARSAPLKSHKAELVAHALVGAHIHGATGPCSKGSGVWKPKPPSARI